MAFPLSNETEEKATMNASWHPGPEYTKGQVDILNHTQLSSSDVFF